MLIKGGKVIDPKNNLNGIYDVLIENGKIKEIANDINEPNEEIINAEGMWIVPGLIDLHVHLREPGGTHKETIKTGAKSASRGGVTTICCMPNTNPVIDNPILVEYIKLKAEKEAIVNILPVGSITKGMNGVELAPIGGMKEKGICAISEDGKSVLNSSLMKTGLTYAKMFDLPTFVHCEDLDLKGDGQINEGEASIRLGLSGISNDVEDTITARDVLLAKSVKSPLHICHLSTKGAVKLVENAKKEVDFITAEVTPHHFTLTDEDIKDYDTNFKMAPPLRAKDDVSEILRGLKENVIDAIATDHAPHHIDEKNCEFEIAMNGIVGLETLVPLTITQLVKKGIITENQFVEKTSLNPATILNIDKGHLGVGAIADIAIINPNEKYVINKNEFLSKSKNTPFHGKEVTGKVKYTIVNGEIVFKD